MKRRSFVFGTIPLCSGLAGCTGLFSDSPMLSVAVFNQAESSYTIEMAFSRTDGDLSRSEARVFSGRIDIEPDEHSISEDVAEQQRYLIEYSLYENNTTLTEQDHFYYYPGDEDESDNLTFDIRSSGVLTRRWAV
ncbi:hypothetical protein [Natranaeroarchaeum sulfidigenes]|uniref:Uncharacterized protein n=1 Tax=Natranaeroarchaeum sulfidigenes TaxID=2784880 RepID=A0A897MMF6_9EURY|nr:hypothetical protein [Natranaeroarchaeum sulfidigenes]QSG01561.1 Uncharacterized protein AArcS_0330 [Natranaeroarchaeum sulfidigenes]